LRKARSDEVAFDASLKAGAFDAACFHAQQAVEKYLKAFLFHHDKEFPYTHNLAKLVEICASVEPSFRSLLDVVAPLTPYAVELKYDADFWPDREVTEEAGLAVSRVRDFVISLLPKGLTGA
jgi:HEPN domain-containing protein